MWDHSTVNYLPPPYKMLDNFFFKIEKNKLWNRRSNSKHKKIYYKNIFPREIEQEFMQKNNQFYLWVFSKKPR